jgi:hypothetical protein
MIKCICGAKMIWGGDHTFEDYCMPGEGMVSNLSCSNRECFVTMLLYQPDEEDEP